MVLACNSNSRGEKNRDQGILGLAESEYYRFNLRLNLRNKVDSVCGRYPMLTPDYHTHANTDN